MTKREMDEYLPGHPPARQIREVRRALKSYGITPQFRYWRLTWQWANKVRLSYPVARPRWPRATEMGAQYMAILLADMRDNYALKLPYRAAEQIPPEVSIALVPLKPLAQTQPAALPAHTEPNPTELF